MGQACTRQQPCPGAPLGELASAVVLRHQALGEFGDVLLGAPGTPRALHARPTSAAGGAGSRGAAGQHARGAAEWAVLSHF